MKYKSTSIRTFIGSKDYEISKTFYTELGFEAVDAGEGMTYFKVNEQLGFYLQDYYEKDWVNNSMVFLEVDDVDQCWEDIRNKKLREKYKNVRMTTIKDFEWGREFFLHDPSGVLWHFGTFK